MVLSKATFLQGSKVILDVEEEGIDKRSILSLDAATDISSSGITCFHSSDGKEYCFAKAQPGACNSFGGPEERRLQFNPYDTKGYQMLPAREMSMSMPGEMSMSMPTAPPATIAPEVGGTLVGTMSMSLPDLGGGTLAGTTAPPATIAPEVGGTLVGMMSKA